MLRIDNVSKRFGGHLVLEDVSLDVAENQVLSLIGPNGSGKSTLFNVINGILSPNGGRVLLDGEDITGLPPHLIAQRGISRTFQMTRIFPTLSVLENVLTGQHTLMRSGFWQQALSLPAVRREDREMRERAARALAFVGLAHYRDARAQTLSIGQRRLLQIAMALVGQGKVLLLDEPAAGLSPPNVDKLVELLREIRDQWKVTILLVEHAMSVVMAVSDRVAVLNHGRKIAEGTPAEVKADPAVIEAYLGRRHA